MRTPEKVNFLWPDDHDGPWIIELHYSPVGGRIECVGFEIRAYRKDRDDTRVLNWQYPLPLASDDGVDDLVYWGSDDDIPGVGIERKGVKPLTASWLREVPLGSLITDKRAGLTEAIQRVLKDAELSNRDRQRLSQRAEEYRASRRGNRRGGRKGYPTEHFAAVAEVYREAYVAGSNPTLAVAERFDISKSTAGKWVHRARQLSLLGKTTRGKAGI